MPEEYVLGRTGAKEMSPERPAVQGRQSAERIVVVLGFQLGLPEECGAQLHTSTVIPSPILPSASTLPYKAHA